jgi:ELWxxDGT repeat protein
VVGNNLFFRAGTGGELWRTDGPTPTRIIDLGATAQILNLTAVGNTLFFTAIDGNGRELWLSDGTAAGTRRISDINPNAASSDPNNLVNLNGTLYFFARNATSSGLYRSTPTGTVTLVQDLPSNLQPPNSLTVVGSRLFFVVNAGTGSTLDRELWQSDGTTPSRVIDINPTGDANPASLTNVNGTLYFTANDGTGVKLWRSDGSVAGTTAIGTAFTGAPPTNLTAVGNRLYFAASSTGNGEELWIL